MNLLSTVNRFHDAKVLVIGDLMIDRFLWSAVDRISPEAPVPVAHVQSSSDALGGAANVAANLSALGVQVDLWGQIGPDPDGDLACRLLIEQGIGTEGIVITQDIPTTVKTRIMAGNHHLLRLDHEKVLELSDEADAALLNKFKEDIAGYKVVIFSDYAKGFISERFAKEAIAYANEKGVLTLSDPTPSTFYKFVHSFLVKPNRKEAEAIAGFSAGDDLSRLHEVGQEVKSKLNVDELIITLGKDGIAIFKDNGSYEKLDTAAKEVYEVTGAGDTTIAAIAASLATGSGLHEAAVIGNLCAGIAVAKLGTCRCSREELLGVLE